MAFIVKKKIGNGEYFYLNENKRIEGKVKTKTIAYLGKNRKDAEDKMKKILKGEIEIKDEAKQKTEKMENKNSDKISIEELAAFCKRKGFVFPSSEIYGGISGFWDFGPMGVEMLDNLKKEWWNFFVRKRRDMMGMEASIISHPKTWEASGHLANFGDLILECSNDKCGNKLRADHFIEDFLKIKTEGMNAAEINDLIKKKNLKCPKCKHAFKELRQFNLLFKTSIGAKEDSSSIAYLRGETAQGMFMNFKNIVNSSRVKLPFGIAQIGKAFRNEIAPRDFLFRSREFHIGEFEFFIFPEEEKCELLEKKHLELKFNFLDSETQEKGKSESRETSIKEILSKKKLVEWHAYWLAEQMFFFKRIGLNFKKIKIREHVKTELSHYSSATFDIDYEFPFGSKEIAGNANRGQYDLMQHMKYGKEKLEIFDDKEKKNVIPKVIEPTFGMERIFLALICDSYFYDKKRENIILKLNPNLSPVKASIFPIVKKDEFEKIAKDVFNDLSSEWKINYDESGSIGRRYARNDEVGTPYCITIDDESIKNEDVTIRNRDTTKQIRVKISHLKNTIRKLLDGEIIFENAGKAVK